MKSTRPARGRIHSELASVSFSEYDRKRVQETIGKGRRNRKRRVEQSPEKPLKRVNRDVSSSIHFEQKNPDDPSGGSALARRSSSATPLRQSTKQAWRADWVMYPGGCSTSFVIADSIHKDILQSRNCCSLYTPSASLRRSDRVVMPYIPYPFSAITFHFRSDTLLNQYRFLSPPSSQILPRHTFLIHISCRNVYLFPFGPSGRP